VPIADYENLTATFNPIKYNADQWVRIAKDAGMKYIVRRKRGNGSVLDIGNGSVLDIGISHPASLVSTVSSIHTLFAFGTHATRCSRLTPPISTRLEFRLSLKKIWFAIGSRRTLLACSTTTKRATTVRFSISNVITTRRYVTSFLPLRFQRASVAVRMPAHRKVIRSLTGRRQSRHIQSSVSANPLADTPPVGWF
jgi:hypothetical protein